MSRWRLPCYRWRVAALLAVAVCALVCVGSGSSGASPALRVAYVVEPNLYVVSADGRQRRLIARDAHSAPASSPDGVRIAYVGPEGALIVLDLARRKSRVIDHVSQTGPWTMLRWSPDGRRLAWVDGDSAYGRELVTISVAGGHRTILARGVAGTPPNWTPDSKRLLYAIFSGQGVWSISLTGNDKLLLDGRPGLTGYALSPSGSSIATLVGNEHRAHLLITNLATGDKRVLRITSPIAQRFGNHIHSVAWAPDGRSVAASWDTDHSVTPHAEAMVFDLRTRKGHTVSKAWGELGLAWAPDGTRIATTQVTFDPSVTLLVAHSLDGRHSRTLAGPSTKLLGFDWINR